MGVAHAGQILAPASRDPRGRRERLFCCIRQPAHQALPNSSGSLAMFAAFRRVSSRAVHSTLFVPRFLSHQDIEFFSAHSANRSYSSAILSIIALGWGSSISSARARLCAARMRHTRAFCHDASEVMRWRPAKSRNPKQLRLGFCCLTLRFLGLEWLGVSGDGSHPVETQRMNDTTVPSELN
jgi:hypothetical protein